MYNKKGFLLAEETLKIILAVIAIGFLIYFLVSLYFSNLNEQTLKSAQQILITSDQSIKNTIDNLNEGESKDLILQKVGSSFNDWALLSFTGFEKPNSCAGKNCLCVCNDFTTNQINECSKNGVCTIVPDLDEDSQVEIELGELLTKISITKQNNKILISKQSGK